MASVLVLWTLGFAGCSPEVDGTPTAERTPPSPEIAIRLLMRNLDVPLSVDASCAGVGTREEDATIGDYLSGFLAEFAAPEGLNHIEASCQDAPSTAGVPVWSCKVVLRHAAGEDQWGWGVEFDVSRSDASVQRSSFRCLGSG